VVYCPSILETSMIHWIPNVEVHGHPYGNVWGSDLVGVRLAKTRENKYASLKFNSFVFPCYFQTNMDQVCVASQSWGRRGSWTITSRGRHQPSLVINRGVLCGSITLDSRDKSFCLHQPPTLISFSSVIHCSVISVPNIPVTTYYC
jgi:hypothetical protein